MGRDTRPEADPPAGAIASAVALARAVRRKAGPGLILAFVAIAICLWTFGELAEDVLEGEPFGFDEPLMHAARSMASPPADAVFLFLSAIGFAWGVIPADIVLVAALAMRRRLRDAAFAGLALGGSGLLNVVAKHTFHRDRPVLWASIAPESTYSFPSGHAMGSATLATVIVLLCRGRPERFRVAAGAAILTIGVGWSRVYLGVHYPSDVLAGWFAAIAWTLVVHVALRRHARGRT